MSVILFTKEVERINSLLDRCLRSVTENWKRGDNEDAIEKFHFYVHGDSKIISNEVGVRPKY